MAIYPVNKTVKTLTAHKPDCRFIRWNQLRSCGCGDTGQKGDQGWFCENHITIDAVNEFMGGKFWAILFCDVCFRE